MKSSGISLDQRLDLLLVSGFEIRFGSLCYVESSIWVHSFSFVLLINYPSTVSSDFWNVETFSLIFYAEDLREWDNDLISKLILSV